MVNNNSCARVTLTLPYLTVKVGVDVDKYPDEIEFSILLLTSATYSDKPLNKRSLV